MKPGESILILPSVALQEMKMEQLAGMKAQVIEIVESNNVIKGCWVKLPVPYLGGYEWFIPYNSFTL